MIYDPEKHHRRSIRLPGYDYSRAGVYFITLVTQKRNCLFGEVEVVEEKMRLNGAGRMVLTVWGELPDQYRGMDIDAFIVMPNHIHGIVVLPGTVGAGPCACPNDAQSDPAGQPRGVAPTLSLGDVVHRFKTMTTKRYADGVKQLGWPPFSGRLWQRNYYEHIVRSEESLNRIRQYVIDNPARWAFFDRDNPNASTPEPENAWQA